MEKDILRELNDFRKKKEEEEKKQKEVPRTLGISVTEETNTGDGLA